MKRGLAMNVSRELQRFAALLAALWALAACGAAFAQAPEQILFGPKRYDHPGVPIGGAVDHFTVPASEVGAPSRTTSTARSTPSRKRSSSSRPTG